jgi:SAM-dependent methyltransferase
MSGSIPDIVGLQRTLYHSRNPTRRWLHTHRRDRILQLVAAAPVSPRRSAMEVGPGSGVYLPGLCAAFEQVTALDIEPAHIEAIRGLTAQSTNLTLIVDDLLTRSWSDPFDFLLVSEVIEHVPEPEPFVQALARALRPGGILLLSTPQIWSLMELTCRIGLSAPVIGLVRKIYGEPVLPTGHISVMSRKSVLALLRRNGFAPIHSETFGLYVPILAEFGGAPGARLAQWLEPAVSRSPASFLLWTQLHLARRI